ncbi:MAG TPA: CHAD domain-containing protein, partial [Myxococcales bacterium]|nr:CHAD domain-containing protein [Myxococcales bacterium]
MKTSRQIAERLQEVQRHAAKLPEPDAVHRMRVATRRLRASLRLLRLRGLEPGVKELQDALGEVRDLQLQVDWLGKRDAALTRQRKARLRRAERALAAALRSWNGRAMPALLEAGAQATALRRKRARKVVRKSLGRLEERLERARSKPAPRSLHRARIAVKQARYLIEMGEDRLPAALPRLLADLKALQASLGQLHDVDVRIGLVKGRPLLLREQRE